VVAASAPDYPHPAILRTDLSLDQLEGDVWGPPKYDSHLVTTCHRLRSKPIGEFDIEELRIMIGQNIGLPFLLTLAVDILEKNPWVSGDMYPGDLLKVTATADFGWRTEPDLSARTKQIVQHALAQIAGSAGSDANRAPAREMPEDIPVRQLRRDLEAALSRFS